MKKFILLTFGFLGWAFYAMSGGADFEPASVRLAAQAAEEGAKPPADNGISIVAKAETPKPAIVDTDPPLKSDEVTRVALNLTTLGEIPNQSDATDDPADEQPQIATQDPSNGSGVPVNPGYAVSSTGTPAIIPSLLINDGASATVKTVAVGGNTGDIRTVTGTRVNVRGGPGTDYEVVTKLGRGDSVEILQDDGQGWVKMRPVEGGPEGWMADFLLVNN